MIEELFGAKVKTGKGSEIKPDNDLVKVFYREFDKYLYFDFCFESIDAENLLMTKSFNKPVGALIKSQEKNSHILLLPPINWNHEEFYTEIKDLFTRAKSGLMFDFTEKAIQYGKRLIEILSEINKNLKANSKKTSKPDWLNNKELANSKVINLQSEIISKKEEIKFLQNSIDTIEIEIKPFETLKDLLFETGKILEDAVLKALKLLGYNANNFRDDDLEIDQIIESPEQDFYIGETEGRDNKAVDGSKISQLISNKIQYVQKKNIEIEGILFGNGFRLNDVKLREKQFTDKCLKIAKDSNIILIQTTDLFKVANYLITSDNKEYAKSCRDTIKISKGKIVEFPDLPK